MSKTALQGACLSVGLVSAWAPVAEAQSEVRFHSNLGVDQITHGMVMLSGSGSGQPFALLSQLTIPGSGSGAFTSPVSRGGVGSGFAMIGISFVSAQPSHLLVSIGGLTVINGDLFTDAFPGWNEGEIMASLFNRTPLAQDFLMSQFNNTFQDAGRMSAVVQYSEALHVGGISFEIVDVPGPGASVMCALPLGLLLRRRRR